MEQTLKTQCMIKRNFFSVPGFPLPSSRQQIFTKRQLLGFSQRQMYEIVSNVGEYQCFVPWCQQSIVYNKSQSGQKTTMKADLVIGFESLSEKYTSHVSLVEPVYVEVSQTTQSSTNKRPFQMILIYLNT